MKAAFLIRCSTKKQDYQRQVNDLTRLCKKLGYETSNDLLFGEHITGKDDVTKRDRASIAHLKEAAQQKKFDVVLVAEVSRMSRDVISGGTYVRQLTNMNIPIYFRDIDMWTIDPITGVPTRNAEEVILGAFQAAWKYLKSMKTQIASARRNELENNQLSIGIPFFGYKRYGGKDRDTKHLWVIDEVKAQIVRDIFAEYLREGSNLRTTALCITERYKDVLKKKMPVGSVIKALMFEPYATGKRDITITDPDNGDVETYTITIPTIISEETFNAASAKRAANKIKNEPYTGQHIYMLTKLLKCPYCGFTMTPRRSMTVIRKDGKEALSWNCMSRQNNSSDCKATGALCNKKLEGTIWALIKKELIHFANLNTEDRKAKVEELNTKIANAESDIKLYENASAALERKREVAYQILLSTEADKDLLLMAADDYHKALAKIKKESAEHTNKINSLKADIQNWTTLRNSYDKPKAPEEAILAAENDPVEKRKLATELIQSISPYKITTYISPARKHRLLKYGVNVLEVVARESVFFVLFNVNQKGDTFKAYYVNLANAVYQNSNRFYNEAVGEKGEYFYIPYPSSLIPDADDSEGGIKLDYAQMVEVCKANNLELISPL